MPDFVTRSLQIHADMLLTRSSSFMASPFERDMRQFFNRLLSEVLTFTAGDEVSTLRGSLKGTVVAVHEDGTLSWRP